MVRPLSHFLLSGIFLFGGWTAFSQPGGRPAKVAAAGIPEPELAVALNGLSWWSLSCCLAWTLCRR